MAVTQNLYTGNGSTTDFPFSFSYINPSYVKVSINGTLTTAFTFFTASILRFTTAPPLGAAIRIYRETTSNALAADYTAGSALREQDLELTLQQVLDVTQETQTFAENQSTAGLQAQITAAGNNASTALTTANTAKATADGLAASIATANSNASSAVSTANTASADASTALSTANSLSGSVTTAQTAAAAAQTAAAAAQSTANAAIPKPAAGLADQCLVTDGAGNFSLSTRGRLALATSVASGTAIDFTGIPSWAKRITVMLNAVSTNGTSVFLVQIGSGTSYSGTIWLDNVSVQQTGGFPVFSPVSSGNNGCGIVVLCRISGELWAEFGNVAFGNIQSIGWSSAGITQSAPTENFDRLRVTTVNGTDTFDAGSVGILYEG